MLAGVEEVNDLDRARKLLVGNVPNPFSAIAHHDFLVGLAPASFPGLYKQTFSEPSDGLDGGHIGGGSDIANRVSLLIQAGLGEHTAKLDLACPRGLALVLPWRPSVSLFRTGTPVPSSKMYRMGTFGPICRGS